MEHCKINGIPISTIDGVVLKPNDRICLGPSAIFIFKNKANEDKASMPDPDDDPISFDFASEEVAKHENSDQKEQQEKARKEQEEASAKMVAELEAKMEREREENLKKLQEKENDLQKMQNNGEGGEQGDLVKAL